MRPSLTMYGEWPSERALALRRQELRTRAAQAGLEALEAAYGHRAHGGEGISADSLRVIGDVFLSKAWPALEEAAALYGDDGKTLAAALDEVDRLRRRLLAAGLEVR